MQVRRAKLEADSWTKQVHEHSVVCKGCRKVIQLDRRSLYYPFPWVRHRAVCRGIKAAVKLQDARKVGFSFGFCSSLKLTTSVGNASKITGAVRGMVFVVFSAPVVPTVCCLQVSWPRRHGFVTSVDCDLVACLSGYRSAASLTCVRDAGCQRRPRPP